MLRSKNGIVWDLVSVQERAGVCYRPDGIVADS